MQSPTHIECSSGFCFFFSSQETGTNTFSSSRVKSKQFLFFLFFFGLFVCFVLFCFGLGVFCLFVCLFVFCCCFFLSFLFLSFFFNFAWRTSHKANEFATLCATCENRVTKLHKPIFPATSSLASLHDPRNARRRTTLGHFQTVSLRANSGQTELGQNGGHDRGWSAQCQHNGEH